MSAMSSDTATGFRRRPPRWRLAAWLVALVAGVAWAARASFNRAPQAELEVLAAVVRRDAGRQKFYHSDSAAIGFHPGAGWTLTVYVGGEPAFRAEHLVLVKLRGVLHADLIQPFHAPMGELRQTRLTGAPLQEYLARTRLDLGPIEGVFADLFHATPVAAAPR
jgi:hypothetical protein